MGRVEELFEWLVDGAPGAATADAVVARLCDEVATEIPIERAAAFVTTLHPHVIGRSFLWNRGEAVKVGEITLGAQQTARYKNSPIALVAAGGGEFRKRLEAPLAEGDYAVLSDLRAAGMTDYVCFPLPFRSGETMSFSFATKRAGGFKDDELARLRRVMRPLSRLAEIMALRRTAANLLSTYVGRNSGERILAGRIAKGDVETVRAVIWFSDQRGFSDASMRKSPREVIAMLNELFDCQVPAIENHGGEVLKFMGDGMLAIFPIGDQQTAGARCRDAVGAAKEAFAALAEKNRDKESPLAFGLALHVGEIAYGNVGGSNRLDFTAIGSSVNLAARLEGLTGKLARPLVVSAEVAAELGDAAEDLGTFELKGVGRAQVFAVT